MTSTLIEKLNGYYYSGSPLVGDNTYDAIENILGKEDVGSNFLADTSHFFILYSLQKVYEGDKLPFQGGIETPKLDGSAIALYYSEGNLIDAVTRGDGKKGISVFNNIRNLVPNYIYNKEQLIQIVGEVVAKKEVKNSRNMASGALHLKNEEEFKKKELYFFPYSFMGIDTKFCFYSQELEYLSNLGFTSVDRVPNIEEFPTDGKVFRINDTEEFIKLGYTQKHPRGAYAYKENLIKKQTTLLDVQWQLGRSGVVAPVAILEPVEIEDASISRATLHNWDYIKNLDLEPNCTVELIRAGSIIPRVTRRIYD